MIDVDLEASVFAGLPDLVYKGQTPFTLIGPQKPYRKPFSSLRSLDPSYVGSFRFGSKQDFFPLLRSTSLLFFTFFFILLLCKR